MGIGGKDGQVQIPKEIEGRILAEEWERKWAEKRERAGPITDGTAFGTRELSGCRLRGDNTSSSSRAGCMGPGKES
jgi:hypothetical protein